MSYVWEVTGKNVFGQKVGRIHETYKEALREKRKLKSVRTKNIKIRRIKERANGKYRY